jgi:TRAP-type C4-dicarboxylate transport system permease small subunit
MTDPNDPNRSDVPPPPPPAYGGAPAYGAGSPSYAAPPAQKTNVLAIVSLVASIAGLVILWGIGSLAGVITGHIAMSQIKKTGEQGRGMALGGLIVGYIGLAFAIIGVIIFVVVFASLATYSGTYTY